MSPTDSSFAARRRFATGLSTLVLLAACGGKPILAPKPKVLTVELQAAPNINPSTAGRPSPVVVRVYELKSAAPFEAADFVTLFEKDQSVLGADVVVRDEFVLTPGESKTIRRDLSPDSKVVAVMAAFRDLERARWRAVLPLAVGSDNTLTVRLEASNVQLGETLMGWRNRVVWTQGMFLQPHHFQQELRFLERLVDARVAGADPHAWGLVEFQLDEGLLALGKLGLARASGVLPDGTPFAMPQFDPLPPALDIAPDVKGEAICLALPLQREGGDEFALDDTQQARMSRYVATQEDVRDASNVSDEPATIQTGRLHARLIRAKDALDAYATLAVALVVERRADGMVVLDRSHIPAQLRLDSTRQLSSSVELLHGLIRQRAETLAGRMGQLGHGVSELASFLMLQTLNRNEPVFAQHAATPVAHPRELHRDCLRLAGDLATLASNTRQPPHFPPYRHDDLRACFTPVFDALRAMLSTVIDSNAVQIDLVDRKHGVRTAVVSDLELVRSASFVLAVNARVPPEQLRQHFPAQTKIGPVDRIRDLVNLQLPGIGLLALPVAPRQLPFHAGYYYFELDRNSDLWGQLESNGSMAMHIAGEFPGLELEFWAIRR